MKRTLEYTLTRTRTNAPLVQLDSPLGNGQEIEPAGLRVLAHALLDLAAAAEKQDSNARHFQPTKGATLLEW